jgi:hypothetical protein
MVSTRSEGQRSGRQEVLELTRPLLVPERESLQVILIRMARAGYVDAWRVSFLLDPSRAEGSYQKQAQYDGVETRCSFAPRETPIGKARCPGHAVRQSAAFMSNNRVSDGGRSRNGFGPDAGRIVTREEGVASWQGGFASLR